MKNSIEILVSPSGRVQTTISTSDGCISMELHRDGLKDSEILANFAVNKRYRNYSGKWTLTMPQEFKVFEAQHFTDLIALALAYTYDRDNPMDVDYSY